MPETPLVTTSARPDCTDVQLDITDEAAVDALIARVRPRAIVNLAAQSFVPAAEANPERTYAVNLLGPMHIARSIMRHVPDCRMIFISSSEVYGASFRDWDRPADETAALAPMNVYAAAKASADLLMGHYAELGLQVTRFRPFNHFGPGQSARFLIPSLVDQIVAAEMRGGATTIKVGNVDSVRDFLDVRDVVAAYAAAIRMPVPLPAGSILNIASGTPRSVASILDQLIKKARVPIGIEQDSRRYRTMDLPMAVGDASRAQRLLGWRPIRKFDNTLDEILSDVRRAKDYAARPGVMRSE